MLDSYRGFKAVESDEDDHFQRLEDRLLADSQWPTVGAECVKRLTPGGFVRTLGAVGYQAPAALRVWGPEVNDVRYVQTLVALPGDAAITVVQSPLPTKCLSFQTEEGQVGTLTHIVTERPVSLGDAGRIIEAEVVLPRGGIKVMYPMMMFAYKGVLAIVVGENPGPFSKVALERMQEKL